MKDVSFDRKVGILQTHLINSGVSNCNLVKSYSIKKVINSDYFTYVQGCMF